MSTSVTRSGQTEPETYQGGHGENLHGLGGGTNRVIMVIDYKVAHELLVHLEGKMAQYNFLSGRFHFNVSTCHTWGFKVRGQSKFNFTYML